MRILNIMRNIIRWIGLAAGIVLFLWFALPAVMAGILNIGNITGIVLSAGLMLYMRFMPSIHKKIREMWEIKHKRWIMCAFGALAGVCAILAVIETGCMVKAVLKTPSKNATAVVLGCRVYGERASLSLVERLEAAYNYLLENPQASCVVSGGKGDGENISEAECMYRWLIDKGIDASRIYKEDRSASTDENISYSKQVIFKEGLNTDIAIVSSEYHLYRAGRIAEKYECEYGTVPGQTAIWLLPTFYVRELYAILAEWMGL